MRVARLAQVLDGRLTSAEEAGTRCLHLESPAAIAIADLGRMQTLQTLLARARGRWLLEMLEASRVATYFQPIICTERPDHVFGYECLTRGIAADERLVSPSEMFEVARNAGLLVPARSRPATASHPRGCEARSDEQGFHQLQPDRDLRPGQLPAEHGAGDRQLAHAAEPVRVRGGGKRHRGGPRASAANSGLLPRSRLPDRAR